MDGVGTRRFPSVVEAAIAAKDSVKEITAATFRSDAAAILESIVAEFGENDILDAMAHQGFEAKAYRSTLLALIKEAKTRRPQRQAGRDSIASNQVATDRQKLATDKLGNRGSRAGLPLYDLEAYLFGEVTKRFEQDGTLPAFDFFCIVIWKANRSKSKIAGRLRSKRHPDLESAVDALLRGIGSAPDNHGRLRVLIEEWGFRLPMASAMLTVLYPEVFTIYDVRVCDVLGDFKDAQNRTQFGALWRRYSEYVEAVRAAVPDNLPLREKDRYLWGRSFAEQLERDVAAGFLKPGQG